MVSKISSVNNILSLLFLVYTSSNTATIHDSIYAIRVQCILPALPLGWIYYKKSCEWGKKDFSLLNNTATVLAMKLNEVSEAETTSFAH